MKVPTVDGRSPRERIARSVSVLYRVIYSVIPCESDDDARVMVHVTHLTWFKTRNGRSMPSSSPQNLVAFSRQSVSQNPIWGILTLTLYLTRAVDTVTVHDKMQNLI